MAVQTNTNYYSNAIVGVPQVGAGIDIHRVDSTPRFQVGFGFERADGAKFRYGQVGATATSRGLLVATADESEEVAMSLQPDIDQDIWAATQTTNPNGVTDPVPNAIGSHRVWITRAATSDNQFAGGYFITTDDTGEGYTYRIKGNDTTDDMATGVIQLELYEPLVEALGTTTDYAIVGNRFANLATPAIALSGTANNCVVGVTCAGISATNYGWIQTKGIVGVLQGGTVPVQGQGVMASTNDTGAIEAVTVTSASGLYNEFKQVIVGYCVDPGDDGGHSVVNLTLE